LNFRFYFFAMGDVIEQNGDLPLIGFAKTESVHIIPTV